MNICKRALCLGLCLCLIICLGGTALAADGSDGISGFFERYDGLWDGITKALESGDSAPLFDSSVFDSLKEHDLSTLLPELKEFQKDTAQLSDAELDAAIRQIAEKHDFTLTDAQVAQLHSVCRGLEKLNAEELQDRAEELKDRLEALGQNVDQAEQDTEETEEKPEKPAGFLGWIKRAAEKVSHFFRSLFGRK